MKLREEIKEKLPDQQINVLWQKHKIPWIHNPRTFVLRGYADEGTSNGPTWQVVK